MGNLSGRLGGVDNACDGIIDLALSVGKAKTAGFA
jgi:hypothetical protein